MLDHYAVSEPAQQPRGRVLILTADNTHDLEFFYPLYRLSEEGYAVEVVTPGGAPLKAKFGMKYERTGSIADARAGDYDLLYIPGGQAPEALKSNKDATRLVQEFASGGKPVAAICHGAQVLAAADVIRGRQISAWPEVKKEIESAGATYADQACAEDGQFITARWPGDLPSHLACVLKRLENAAAAPRKAAATR